MAKSKVFYTCRECGAQSASWVGRCSECGLFNTMEEEIIRKEKENKHVFKNPEGNQAEIISINEISSSATDRISTGINEFDRPLGGGIVPGAFMLIGGDPGIGKSTLLLQTALKISKNTKETVLYVTGEESAAQIKLRADRLGDINENLLIYSETNLEQIIDKSLKIKPILLIIDSIQTMYSDNIESAPGSVSQLRESTAKLLRFSKENHISTVLIGHVTKEGNIAGPKLLEHMVDVVLYFEGERNYAFRALRAIKNRFGPTYDSGIFSMEEDGLREVLNPSSILLAQRPKHAPGSVVLTYLEGARPLLIEIQALASTTCFGMPRRMSTGFDYNRLIMLIAILEKRLGLMLGNQDVYANVVGGFKITERAADLAVSLSIVSSLKNIAVNDKTVVMGEVGLTGEIRTVHRIEERIRESVSLGFERFIIPKGNLATLNIKGNKSNIEIIGVNNISEAMEAAFV